MVSFYIVETGLNENLDEVRHSVLWENAFLDIFFDAGHIVCNAPILRLERKTNEDITKVVDLKEARDLGVDFVIITQLDYTTDVKTPEDISFFIYNLLTYELLLEKKIVASSIKKANIEYDDIKSVVRGFVPYIKN